MLNKNLYLVYPAGYHGNYIKWAVEVSDADNTTVTKDPINTSNSQKFGGIGTAHIHARVPTHQDLWLHHIWCMSNKPRDHRVYLINSGTKRVDVSDQISQLLLEDPTGIVINLHDDDDETWAAYGRINCVTKWPTFMAVSKSFADIHEKFDAFDCAKDMLFRNQMVEHQPLGSCGRPDRNLIQAHLDRYGSWFAGRNRYQPHEVNHETYPRMPDIKSRFFDFSLREILDQDFPYKLRQLIETTGIISRVDTDPVERIHARYRETQPNLRWFESLAHWTETGNLDHYLQSHSIIEAELITRIFKDMGVGFALHDQIVQWLYAYNNRIRDQSWPFLQEPSEFYALPQRIKDELLHVHQIAPIERLPSDEFVPEWQTQSLQEINAIYQKLRQQSWPTSG